MQGYRLPRLQDTGCKHTLHSLAAPKGAGGYLSLSLALCSYQSGVGSLTFIAVTTLVALDIIGSHRKIWPGHLSTANEKCRLSDKGLWHVHNWARKLRENPATSQRTAKSGDKPDDKHSDTFFP